MTELSSDSVHVGFGLDVGDVQTLRCSCHSSRCSYSWFQLVTPLIIGIQDRNVRTVARCMIDIAGTDMSCSIHTSRHVGKR